MAQPTAYEASKMTGLLGGLGRGRHRFQPTMMAKPPVAKAAKKKAKLPTTAGAGFQTADEGMGDNEPDPMDPNEGAEGEAPHKGGIGLTIGIHHLGPSQMAAMKSMQSKKSRFGGSV